MLDTYPSLQDSENWRTQNQQPQAQVADIALHTSLESLTEDQDTSTRPVSEEQS